MLAESSRLFQLLGILQLLNTFSISSFLNTGIGHGINYDSACTAFDNALVTIKKKIGHFLCYFAGNFPHRLTLLRSWSHPRVLYQERAATSHMFNSHSKMPDFGR